MHTTHIDRDSNLVCSECLSQTMYRKCFEKHEPTNFSFFGILSARATGRFFLFEGWFDVCFFFIFLLFPFFVFFVFFDFFFISSVFFDFLLFLVFFRLSSPFSAFLRLFPPFLPFSPFFHLKILKNFTFLIESFQIPGERVHYSVHWKFIFQNVASWGSANWKHERLAKFLKA